MFKKIFIPFTLLTFLIQDIQAVQECDEIIKRCHMYVGNYSWVKYVDIDKIYSDNSLKSILHYFSLNYKFLMIKWNNNVFYSGFSLGMSKRKFNLTKSAIFGNMHEAAGPFGINFNQEALPNYNDNVEENNEQLEEEEENNDHSEEEEDINQHPNNVANNIIMDNNENVNQYVNNVNNHINTAQKRTCINYITLSFDLGYAHKIHKELYWTFDLCFFTGIPSFNKKDLEKDEYYFIDTRQSIYGLSCSFSFKFCLTSSLYAHFSPIKFEAFYPYMEITENKNIMGNSNYAFHICTLGLYL